MKLLSKNQLVGTSPGFAIVRDLFEDEDGTRISVHKSASFEVIRDDRELSPEQLIAKYPMKPRLYVGARTPGN